MPSNIAVSVTADISDLRSKLAIAGAVARGFGTEARNLANEMVKSGQATAEQRAHLAQFSGAAAKARSDIAAMTTQLRGSAEGFKINAGGMMEMRAAAVNSFQAIASGMDVARVAMMEGAQVIGGLIQGGVGLSALVSPIGAIAGAAVIASAALAFLAYRAYQTKQNIDDLVRSMQLAGRGGSASEFEEIAAKIATNWELTKHEASEVLKILGDGNRLTKDQLAMQAEAVAARARQTREPLDDVAKAFNVKGAADAVKIVHDLNLATEDENKKLREMMENNKPGNALEMALKLIHDRIVDIAKDIPTATQRLKELASHTGAPGDLPPMPTSEADFKKGAGASGTAWDMRGWLKARGYSDEAAAAVMGNAKVESNFSTTVENPKSGATGLFQWLGTRKTAVQSEAGTDFIRQLEFMDKELTQIDPTFKKATGSVATLTARFEDKFERSGGSLMSDRLAAAQRYYDSGGGKDRKSDEEVKAAQDRQAEDAARNQSSAAILNRHSLDQQLAAAKDHAVQMANIYGNDSKQAKDAVVAVGQKDAEVYDATTAIYIAQLRERMAATQSSAEKIRLFDQITAYQQQRGSASEGGGVDKTVMAQYAIERANLVRQGAAEDRSIEIQKAQRQQQFNDINLRTIKLNLDQEVAAGRMTAEQELAIERLKTEEIEGLNIRRLQGALDAMKAQGAGAKELEQLELSIEQAKLKKRQDIAAIDATRSNRIQSIYGGIRDEVSGGLAHGVVGLATGQTNAAQAAGQLAESVATRALEGLFNKLIDSTLKDIGTKLISSVLDIGQDANTTALLANTAAVTANTAAAGVSAGAAAAGGAGSALGGAASAAGGAASLASGGGFFSWVGSLLPALALSGGGVVPRARGGWIVPAAANGMPALPGSFGTDSVLAALTPGETVLPADERPSMIADNLANSMAGTTVHNHYYQNTITALSPKDAVDAVNKAMRLGGGRLRM